MSDEPDCLKAALGEGVDPSGVAWEELDTKVLRASRQSLKWTRYQADVLPMFVAEMDFAVAPEIRRRLVRAVEASDTGYLDGPGPLAGAFADYANDLWGWEVREPHVHLATDVATGIVESLRVFRPAGGRLALPTPCYPGFFEMLSELNFEVVEVPLLESVDGALATLDLAAIEQAFASNGGIDAFVLCNPHNPHGIPFDREALASLARLAAEHDVFVVSDEVHSPLTHRTATFTPFAPLAAEAGALSVTTTSASKGWNLAGAKCSVIVAADERAARTLENLPPEVVTRSSILGLHANVAAFTEAREWQQRTIAQIEANQRLFAELLSIQVPEITYTPGTASYLGWLDLRALFTDLDTNEEPAERVLHAGRVALNNGRFFGRGGSGFARINLAASPHTIVEGVRRIAALKGSRA